MNRDSAINILNANIQNIDVESLITFIEEFLIENKIEKQRIDIFIKTICTEPIYRINDFFNICLDYSIKYFIRKLEINSVQSQKNQKTILYY